MSTGGEARDVALDGTTAYVADFAKSLTVVNVANPASPVLGASTPTQTGGLLADLTRVGRFAIGADVYFVNGVPIVDVSVPATRSRARSSTSPTPTAWGSPPRRVRVSDGGGRDVDEAASSAPRSSSASIRAQRPGGRRRR